MTTVFFIKAKPYMLEHERVSEDECKGKLVISLEEMPVKEIKELTKALVDAKKVVIENDAITVERERRTDCNGCFGASGGDCQKCNETR